MPCAGSLCAAWCHVLFARASEMQRAPPSSSCCHVQGTCEQLGCQVSRICTACAGLRLTSPATFTAQLWHAVACGCIGDKAYFIETTLAQCCKANRHHCVIVARCCMWFHGNLAHFIVPLLACFGNPGEFHSAAVACCRMWLHWQLGTFRRLRWHTVSTPAQDVRCSRSGCGILLHAVALATMHFS